MGFDFYAARARMVGLANDVVGLGAADPEPYLALVGEHESDAMRTSMLTMSGCGLTVRGLWRRIGMIDERLEAPYEPGAVMKSIQDMAHEAGAWSAGGEGLVDLKVGDVVYVSQPDHVGTIVSVDRPGDGSVKVKTVDGGSLDASGRQVIVTYERAFTLDGDVTAGPMAGQGRRVVGSVGLGAMVEHFGGAALPWGLVAGAAAVGLAGWWAYRNVPAVSRRARRLLRG